MLYSKVLDNKKRFTKPNGDIVLDLTVSSINFRNNVEVNDIFLVGEDFIMRADLVSETVYGDSTKWDYILKFNGISNPFSLNKYDLISIPDLDSMDSQFKKEVEKSESTDSYDSYDGYVELDSVTGSKEPRTKKDENRKKYIDEIKDNRLDRSIPVPPNVVGDDEDNIRFEDNKIIFGDNVTGSVDKNCDALSTKARVKEALLSRRNISQALQSTTETQINQSSNVNENTATQ